MPPRKKTAAAPKKAAQTLSNLVGSDAEGSASEQQARVPTKRKAPAAKKPEAKKAKTTSTEAEEPPAKKTRARPAKKAAAEAEEEEEEAEEEATKAPTKRKAPAKKPVSKKAAEPEPESDEEAEDEPEEEDSIVVAEAVPTEAPTKAATKKASTAKPAPAPVPASVPEKKKRMTKREEALLAREVAATAESPEVTQEPTESSESPEELSSNVIPGTPTQVHSAERYAAEHKGKVQGRKTSAAAAEDEDDLNAVPALGKSRRNTVDLKEFNDLQKRLAALEKANELLEKQNKQLHETRETEAEKGLKNTREQMYTNAKQSAAAIKALTAQSAAHDKLAARVVGYKKKAEAKDMEVMNYQGKIGDLERDLAAARKETQLANAKLAQAQQQHKVGVPGSAQKPRMGLAGKASAADHELWTARVKEKLHEDLSGLVVMGARKDGDSVVYDCLLSGNAGSLHFKLSVRDEDAPPRKPPVASQDPDDKEDEDIIFIPLLQPDRDSVVISLLPEYMREEISFRRDQLGRFYQKVTGTLSTVVESEGEEGASSYADAETTRGTQLTEGSMVTDDTGA